MEYLHYLTTPTRPAGAAAAEIYHFEVSFLATFMTSISPRVSSNSLEIGVTNFVGIAHHKPIARWKETKMTSVYIEKISC